MPMGRGGRKLIPIIDVPAKEKATYNSDFSSPEASQTVAPDLLHCLLNSRLCQRSHDLVSRRIRMQTVVGQIFLEQALVVNEG
jgi:hypothetical protein